MEQKMAHFFSRGEGPRESNRKTCFPGLTFWFPTRCAPTPLLVNQSGQLYCYVLFHWRVIVRKIKLLSYHLVRLVTGEHLQRLTSTIFPSRAGIPWNHLPFSPWDHVYNYLEFPWSLIRGNSVEEDSAWVFIDGMTSFGVSLTKMRKEASKVKASA